MNTEKINKNIKKSSRANYIGWKKSLNILISMVKRNTKAQYRNSLLGIFWTILNPLLNMLVITLVFTNIFGRNMQAGMDYSIYVLTGNLVFNLMRMATQNSLPSIVNNYDLMTKTRVPKAVFPMANSLSSIVNFLFSLVALFVVMIFKMSNGIRFNWTILLMPLTFLPSIFAFSLGIAFALSAMYVFFRDIQHIYGVFLSLWLYFTPIFYDINILSNDIQNLMMFNPMYHYLKIFREVTILGKVPMLNDILLIYLIGIITLLIGYIIFKKKSKDFIFYI